MEKVYLKFPSIEDKDNWIEYINEYRKNNPKATPLGCNEKINYENWIIRLEKSHQGIDLEEGRVPSSTYFFMKDDRIIGTISIRHNINTEILSTYGGHIGYGVRPSERRKGYATIMLNLALEKCEELGLEDVMVTCREDNIASAKTIENNYGVLKETIFIPEENSNFKKYWINVKQALNQKDTIRKK